MASIQGNDERVSQAQERFRSWREGRRRGQKISVDLWRAAVELADSYSLEQVAAALRLNEKRLAKRVSAKQGRIGKAPETASTSRNGFVEIGIAGEAPQAECSIEVRLADGGSLVVRVPVSAPDVVTRIVHSLWDRGA
jgi:hypothetical protein